MATVTETTTATAQLRQLTFTDIFGRGQYHFLTFACVGCSLGFAEFLALVLFRLILFFYDIHSSMPQYARNHSPTSFVWTMEVSFGEPTRPLMLTKECLSLLVQSLRHWSVWILEYLRRSFVCYKRSLFSRVQIVDDDVIYRLWKIQVKITFLNFWQFFY
jgi:hypothetical protein